MLWIFDGEVNPSALLVVGGFCLLSARVCVSVVKAVGVLLFYFIFPSRCEAISDHTRRRTRLCSRQLASAAAVAWELQIRLKPTGSEQQAPRSLSRQHTQTHTYTLTHSIGGAVSDTFSCCAVGSPRGSCMRYRHGPQGKGETGSSKRGVESAARHRNMVLPFLSSSLLPSLVGSEVGMDPWERSWKGARESSSRTCDLMRESK